MWEKKILLMFLLLFILLLTSCNNTESCVMLCDYSNILIPKDEYSVSENDLNFAIEMMLRENNVVVEKELQDIISDGDVTDIEIQDFSCKKTVRITVGNEEYGADLDNLLLGKKRGDSFDFLIGENISTITVKKIFVYAETLDDEIANIFFGITNSDILKANVKEEIKNHRIFEYFYSQIISSSRVKVKYKSKNDYLSNFTYIMTERANKQSQKLNDYIKYYYDMSFVELEKRMSDFYDEYMILKELCEKENITISEEEYKESLSQCAESLSETEDDVIKIYGKEYVNYFVYYAKVYDVLLQYTER